ncbi:MAG: glycerophosphodiester phosphodiesterase family protein [Alistipes sp.]
MKRILFLTATLLLSTLLAAAQPKVIAHRGYWLAPGSAENSIASFTKADSIGVFGSEIDVWMTGDNGLIVNHDRVYEGTQIDMETASLKQITSIVLPNGETIPTLDAYLKTVAAKPQTRLILEMKSLSDMRREDIEVQKIIKALRKYDLLERTDFIGFSINACLEFRKSLPDARVFYLDGDLSPKKIKSLGLTGIDYSTKVMRRHPEWVDQAHKLGLEVNVWTVNSTEDMNYFIGLGVDYITTNYPEQLLALLKK